ncbi:hypothetical protein WJX73_005461 [Symbiochloris irregularis]|uniref:DNA topoisomerase (ATP-hydrolyzing) n=1 Tax=Symbiochloris irregularis TaxID=706552 RepID=A0AAW1PZB4_9CHLO
MQPYLARCSRTWLPPSLHGWTSCLRSVGPLLGQALNVDAQGHQRATRGVIDIELKAEAEDSYVAYAMSVIIGRALPDVRDGLKPVHRRILYAMHDLGLLHSRPYRKCARVVGEVLGKYHPHGDTAVYDALVRLAQGFSMRAPLIAGHGNFGSLDNDPPAAMRYTECRLQALTSAVFLSDLAFDTVRWMPTFDGSLEEPFVLPARVPHLLVNGTSGIAVGIATRMPPHNLREVVQGLKALIADPDISLSGLMKHIPAPDFPTGGEIIAAETLSDVYASGRGPITVRGQAFIEEPDTGAKGKKGAKGKGKAKGAALAGTSTKPLIVITELPYQTNKAGFVANVASLVEAGKLTGVADVRDESDREGMRVVVEPKRGVDPAVILNSLYQTTTLQSRFPVNMVAIVNRQPEKLSLKDCLRHFLDFRIEVVEKRARHHLGNAQRRQHIVEGLLKAHASLDAVVQLIRQAPDGPAAAAGLQKDYQLDSDQADAILSMTLRRLTTLESGKLQEEAAKLTQQVQDLQQLLADPKLVLKVIGDEAQEMADKFGDDRRTKVLQDVDGKLTVEDITTNGKSLVVFSSKGFIKRMPADTFSVQNRGGRGVKGTQLRNNDTVEDVVLVNDHDHLLFITAGGVARTLKAHQVPLGSRTSSGTAASQVLALKSGEAVAAMLPVSTFDWKPAYEGGQDYLLLLTRGAKIKKVALEHFKDMKKGGLKAMRIQDDDELVWVGKCTENCSVMLAASDGMVLHFPTDEANLPARSRTAGGQPAIRLTGKYRKSPYLIGMSILPAEGPCALIVTKQGQGKLVAVENMKLSKRYQMGYAAMRLFQGDSLAALHMVEGGEAGQQAEVLMASAQGLMSRTTLGAIPVGSRRHMGVRLLNLQDGDVVSTVTVLPASEEASQ